MHEKDQVEKAGSDERALSRPLRMGRVEVVSWALVALWVVMIFIMSAKTGSDYLLGTNIPAIVKRWLASVMAMIAGHKVSVSPIGHFVEYFVLGILLFNALRFRVAPLATLGVTVGLIAVFAATDELHQWFVPGRKCDPEDWVVDVCAAIIAAFISWAVAAHRDSVRAARARTSPESKLGSTAES